MKPKRRDNFVLYFAYTIHIRHVILEKKHGGGGGVPENQSDVASPLFERIN
jgi:hypothetical protein